MSRRRNGSTEAFDVTEVFGDPEFDLDGFLESMDEDSMEELQPRATRAAWQLVEERRDARWLREQLREWDWDDWDHESH